MSLQSELVKRHHARPAFFSFGHDLVGKPVSTFPDHAPKCDERLGWRKPPAKTIASM